MDCINTAEIIKMLRWIQQDLTMRRILWPRFGETPIEMDLTLKVTNDLAEAIFGDIFDSETDLEYYTQAVYDALGTMQAGYLLLKRQWGGSRSPRGSMYSRSTVSFLMVDWSFNYSFCKETAGSVLFATLRTQRRCRLGCGTGDLPTC